MSTSTSLADLRANAHLPAKEYGSNNLAKFFAANKKQIESVIPKHMTSERLLRIAFNAITHTPALAECTVESLLGSVIQSAILGVEPNTPLGQAYLVPFFNGKKKTREVQFIIGYKGLIDLARRSGQIESINAHEVYQNDEFEFAYGLEEKLEHKPTWQKDPGQMIGAYAVAKFKDGGYVFEVMSIDQIISIRDKSQGYKASKQFGFPSPWDENFPEMARKTVIRRIAKYLPMSIEMQTIDAMEKIADKGLPQGLEGALEGDFVIVPPTDESLAEQYQAEIDKQGWYTSPTGEKINAHGEIWNPEQHATSKELQLPIINSDGTFRARRHLNKEPALVGSDKNEGNTASGAGSRPTGAVPPGQEEEEDDDPPAGQAARQASKPATMGLD